MIGKRKSRRVSMELSKVVLLGLVFCAVAVEGQTTVTTSGGTTNTVPLFTGSSTLGQSPISFSSGSMVVAGTAGSSIGTFLNQGGTNAVGGLLLQTPTSSNTGTNELFEWYFNEDSVHVLSRSLSLFQYPSDSLGGFMHQHAAFGITSTGSSYQYFSGNVGIGTTTPGAKLEVNGNVLLTAGSGASMTYPDGTVQSTAWNGVLSGGDYAESVNVSGGRDEYEPGDVLVIDPASEGRFLKSSAPYSTAVTGIYSTRPGVVGRRQRTARARMDEEVPMAMTGIVPTKVSAENGPIKPGDLLVTSSRPGYAMRGTDRTQMLGAVIGKAIGHLDSGVGVIEAVVTLQ